MKKSKIKSVKSLGVQKTFNLTMESSQHNYALHSPERKGPFVITKNSAQYGMWAYRTMYLHTHHPDLFLASSMRHKSNAKQIARLYQECHRMRVPVHLPTINSPAHPTPVCGEIEMGLSLVKGIGESVIDEMVGNQPYKGFVDFSGNVNRSIVKANNVEAMIRAGCFDQIVGGRTEAARRFLSAYFKAKSAKNTSKKYDPDMLVLFDTNQYLNQEIDDENKAKFDELMRIDDMESFGFIARRIKDDTIPICEFVDQPMEIGFWFFGHVMRSNHLKGKPVVFVTLEDHTGETRAVLTKKFFDNYHSKIRVGMWGRFFLLKTEFRGEDSYEIEYVEPFEGSFVYDQSER